MKQPLETVCDDLIENVGQLAANFGLNRIVGQIYILLFISNTSLSLDQITEKLKISKGNASVNTRELERWGAVKKVWVKGSRKDFYKAVSNVLQVTIRSVSAGILRRLGEFQPEIERMEKMLDGNENKLTSEQKKVALTYRERIQDVRKTLFTVQTVLTKLPESFLGKMILRKSL